MPNSDAGLKLPLTLKAIMDNQVLQGIPEEVCGFLGGKHGIVSDIMPIENISAQPRASYLMDGQQLIMALLALEARGLDLLAIYHSHPAGGPQTLSQTDIEEAAYPEVAHILALPSPDLTTIAYRAYRISRDKVVSEVPLEIT